MGRRKPPRRDAPKLFSPDSHRRERGTGQLFLISTPIGNLEDITLRALRVLGEVDLIACEDTRHTRKLLIYYQIRKPTLSYHKHNELTRAPELILKLEEGADIGLASDAGMPLISDPGYRLVTLAIRHKIPVIPVPGPSALAAALSASGLPPDPFSFHGFLPAKRSSREKVLAGLRTVANTIILYESPHRLAEVLRDAQRILGDRRIVLARELTKVHEEFLRGRISEVLDQIEERDVMGEMTLLIAPPAGEAEEPVHTGLPLAEQIAQVMRAKDVREREAVKIVARARGLPRSEAYRQWQRRKEAVLERRDPD